MYNRYLTWIETQQDAMVELLIKWANINSGSYNLPGLAQMIVALKEAFSSLGGEIEEIPLKAGFKIDSKGQKLNVPSASALRITKHPTAPLQIFLGGHMDTVYGVGSPFQTTTMLDKNILRGPGVADMKGGLVIMLKALESLEKSPFAGKIGWEVLINPDEEIGSQGSEELFIQAAKRSHIAFLFEPAFSDGSIVTARKGSANFALVAKGRAAHAGRDFHLGCNAISAVVRFISAIENLNDPQKGTTINIGHIEGGGPINIVPDLAICRFNVRTVDPKDFEALYLDLQKAVEAGNSREGISLTLWELAARSPKSFDDKNQRLFETVQTCAKELGFLIEGKPSGGVCDGNILSAEGVPTIDTLGVVGGNIHTEDEYALVNTLTQRATLAALLLMKFANQEIGRTVYERENVGS